MSTKKDKNYINGPLLHSMIVDWYNSGKEEPPVEIFLAVSQICDRLATRYNFGNYSYNDEMVGDAKLACYNAIYGKKYNPEKSTNPFAYFTKIAWNAMINVIKLEHKESFLKHKALMNCMLEASLRGEVIEMSLDDSGRMDDLISEFDLKGKTNE